MRKLCWRLSLTRSTFYLWKTGDKSCTAKVDRMARTSMRLQDSPMRLQRLSSIVDFSEIPRTAKRWQIDKVNLRWQSSEILSLRLVGMSETKLTETLRKSQLRLTAHLKGYIRVTEVVTQHQLKEVRYKLSLSGKPWKEGPSNAKIISWTLRQLRSSSVIPTNNS